MNVYEERYPAEFWFSCYSHFELSGVAEISSQKLTENKRLIFYDVETQKRAEEVGGWENADKMLISVAVTYSPEDDFKVWYEKDVPEMIRYMNTFDMVVSFNGDNFDSKVLSHYGDVAAINKKSFDVAQYLSGRLKHRIRLDNVATATLNVGKSADGLLALQWWKEGRIDEIVDYCKQDVSVLRDIVAFGRENGHVLYSDSQNNLSSNVLKVAVDW
jgi:DEAD/DEAH box helicase domain-containing protein